MATFTFLDSLQLGFVGSVTLDEHKKLVQIPNDDPRLEACDSAELDNTKAYRVIKEVYGQERALVVTYNQNLFNTQWQTLQNDLTKATERLSCLQQKLDDRINGLIIKGKAPTIESVAEQCQAALSRQHLKKIIQIKFNTTNDHLPSLKYTIDHEAIESAD